MQRSCRPHAFVITSSITAEYQQHTAGNVQKAQGSYLDRSMPDILAPMCVITGCVSCKIVQHTSSMLHVLC